MAEPLAARFADEERHRPLPIALRDGCIAMFRRHTAGAVAGVICLAIALSTLLAPWIAPYDPLTPDTAHLLQGPSLAHPFGTDAFGRDLLSRTLLGGRPTLAASLAAVALAATIGLAIGVVAGYRRGLLDSVLMRLMDVLLSFPFVLLALVLVAALGPGVLNLTIAIACTQIPVFARLCRALALSIGAAPYIEAASAAGVGHTRIIWRHMLPNMLRPADRAGRHHHRSGDRAGLRLQLPGAGHPAAHPGLGGYGQRRQGLHLHHAAPGAGPWRGDHDHRGGDQLPVRCAPRHARPDHTVTGEGACHYDPQRQAREPPARAG